MKQRLLFVSLAMLLHGAVADEIAQADAPPAPSPATAQASLIVNGKPISDELFFAYRAEQARANPELARGMSEKQQIRMLNQLLNMTLLSQQAEKQGLENNPLVAAALDVARMNTLAEAVIGEYLDKHPVTEKEIDQAYQEVYVGHPATEYQVSHILTKTKEEAEQAIADLEAGKPFAEVAKARSIDPSAKEGGNLGWLDAAALAGPIGDQVKQMKKGEISHEPVKSDFGYHVFLLRDTRRLPPPKLAEVRDTIVTKLKKERLGKWIGELRKQAKIETPRQKEISAALEKRRQEAAKAKTPEAAAAENSESSK